MAYRPLRPSPSPRIGRLRAGHDTGRFWGEITATGAPLIEPVPGDAASRLVTFVQQDDGSGGEVLLILNGVTDWDRHTHGDVSPHLLDRWQGTDVRYATYRLPADMRATYRMFDCEAVPACDRAAWLSVMDRARPDVHNPVRAVGAFGRSASLLELPDAPPMRYAAVRSNVPAGQLRQTRIGGRPVWGYLPPGHEPGRAYPVVVFLDGGIWASTSPIMPTLDNLIAEGRIPPMVAVMVDSLGADERTRDLTCHEPFVTYLVDEVLTWAAAEAGATADPARTIIAGQSFGGLAAAYAGLVAAHRFGNVLCQSGSFWWPQDDPLWLPKQYAAAEVVPVRFFMQAGRHEVLLLPTVDEFATVLSDKGYRVTRADFTGGHDYACWLPGLADGLIDLAGEW
jgi:enterochelin esterase-like enzyme